MANRPLPDLDTKNPGSLAGESGVPIGSAGEHEQGEPYSIPPSLSSVPGPVFRALLIGGRFICLEAAR